MIRRRGPGLVRAAATTAVVAGTAGAVRHRQEQKYASRTSRRTTSRWRPSRPRRLLRGRTRGARLRRRARAARAAEGPGDNHRGGVRGEEEADPRDLSGSKWEKGPPSRGPFSYGRRPIHTCGGRRMYGRHLLAAVPLPASAESPGSPGLSRETAWLSGGCRGCRRTRAMRRRWRSGRSSVRDVHETALPALDVSNPDGPHTRPGSISSSRVLTQFRRWPLFGLREPRVGLGWRKAVSVDACAVPNRRRVHRVRRDPLAGADREHDRGLVTRADDHVLRARRAVEEVPRAQWTLLTFDDEEALSAEHEKALLSGLLVVHRHRLSRRQDVEVDTEVVERRVVSSFEPTVATELVVEPRRVAGVDDEPAVALRNPADDIRSGGHNGVDYGPWAMLLTRAMNPVRFLDANKRKSPPSAAASRRPHE